MAKEVKPNDPPPAPEVDEDEGVVFGHFKITDDEIKNQIRYNAAARVLADRTKARLNQPKPPEGAPKKKGGLDWS